MPLATSYLGDKMGKRRDVIIFITGDT